MAHLHPGRHRGAQFLASSKDLTGRHTLPQRNARAKRIVPRLGGSSPDSLVICLSARFPLGQRSRRARSFWKPADGIWAKRLAKSFALAIPNSGLRSRRGRWNQYAHRHRPPRSILTILCALIRPGALPVARVHGSPRSHALLCPGLTSIVSFVVSLCELLGCGRRRGPTAPYLILALLRRAPGTFSC
jgi:hypothetical protein